MAIISRSGPVEVGVLGVLQHPQYFLKLDKKYQLAPPILLDYWRNVLQKSLAPPIFFTFHQACTLTNKQTSPCVLLCSSVPVLQWKLKHLKVEDQNNIFVLVSLIARDNKNAKKICTNLCSILPRDKIMHILKVRMKMSNFKQTWLSSPE